MYEMKSRVGYSELDTEGRMSLRALLNVYQNVATFHSEDDAMPLTELMAQRRGWFVVSYQMRNYRMPLHGEIITVKTIPVKIKGFVGGRVFEVYDNHGELLCESFSEWVFMDLDNLRPARVLQEMVSGYRPDDYDQSKWGTRKIEIIGKKEDCGCFVVNGIFVDTNGHMNNAYYIDIALNAIEDEYPYIRIEYKLSAKKDDKILIKRIFNKNKAIVTLENTEGKYFCVAEFSKGEENA